MANAHNGHAAVSPHAAIQPKLQTPPKPSAPQAASRAPTPTSVVPPAPQPPRLSSDRPRSSASPVPPRPLGANESGAIAKHVDGPPPSALARSDDARALVRAAVDEAVAPLRDRLDELERTMLETILRLSGSAAAPRAPSRVETPVKAPARTTPPPLPAQPASAALPPVEASTSITAPAVQAFAAPEPTTVPAPAPNDAGWEYAVGAGERRRRQVLAVLAGVIVLGAGTLFAMLASCS
jgi:hypothetical protein